MARRLSGRRVKLYRKVTVCDAADVPGACEHAVGRWIAAGLPTTDVVRPHSFPVVDLGVPLRAREPIRRKCRLGKYYCLRRNLRDGEVRHER